MYSNLVSSISELMREILKMISYSSLRSTIIWSKPRWAHFYYYGGLVVKQILEMSRQMGFHPIKPKMKKIHNISTHLSGTSNYTRNRPLPIFCFVLLTLPLLLWMTCNEEAALRKYYLSFWKIKNTVGWNPVYVESFVVLDKKQLI